jgi:hypothetical protein
MAVPRQRASIVDALGRSFPVGTSDSELVAGDNFGVEKYLHEAGRGLYTPSERG